MKKKNLIKGLILLAVILNLTTSFGQSVVITTVVDGTLKNSGCDTGSGASDPRFVELYVDGTINFAGYDLGYSADGGSYVKKGLDDFGTISDSFIYVIADRDDDTFNGAFPGRTFISLSATSINGNEAFNITDNSNTILDSFGIPGEVSGSVDKSQTWSYEDSYAKRKDFITSNAGTFVSENWTYGGANALDGATCTTLASAVTLGSFSLKTTTWDGDTSSAWSDTNNWSNGIPTLGYNASIPDVATAPIIGSSTGAKVGDLTITETEGVTINSGGTLIISGTSTGNVTYQRSLGTENWYLVSSPVSGEIMTDMRANNSFASGSGGSRIGFAPYDNSQAVASDRWSYFTTSSTDDLVDGKGYSASLSSSGNISFAGTLNTSDVSIALTQGGVNGTNFNLLGNPYTSFINSGTFLTTNTAELAQEEIYIWNQGTTSYDTKVTINAFKIAPGQGFFVEANATNNVTFSESIQSHEATDTFQKSNSSRPEIKINITDNTSSRYAEIYYINGTTTGFDNGYDGKLFGGVPQPFAVYTYLVSDSEGKNYQIQSLPNSNHESMVIPIGINADTGKEITFTASALNLPSELKVYLEDRETNLFTRLDEANSNYKITLTEALNGIGRFYLHTAQKALRVNSNLALESISIYKTNNSTLRIVGLSQGKTNVKLFNMLGKQALSSSFTSNGVQDIPLPKLATGVYVVQLETETGKLNKKIILE